MQQAPGSSKLQRRGWLGLLVDAAVVRLPKVGVPGEVFPEVLNVDLRVVEEGPGQLTNIELRPPAVLVGHGHTVLGLHVYLQRHVLREVRRAPVALERVHLCKRRFHRQ